MKLKAIKCWQGQDSLLVWHIEIPKEFRSLSEASEGDSPKKAFLVLNPQPGSLIITPQKPLDLVPDGALINILRKYARAGFLTNIQHSVATGEIVLEIYSKDLGAKPLLVYLDKERPRCIHLIDLNRSLSLVRSSPLKTYTKPQHVDAATLFDPAAMSLLSWEDLNPSVSSTARASAPDKSQAQEGDPSNGATPRFQKELMASIKRRIKTLKKSLHQDQLHYEKHQAFETLYQEAQLLQQSMHLYSPGDHALTAPSAKGAIVIKLDPQKNLGQNIDAKYKLYKKQKASLTHLTTQINLTKDGIATLQTTLEDLQHNLLTMSDHDRLRQVLKLRKQVPKGHQNTVQANATKSPYKTYQSSTGQLILVGKSALENDLLTKGSRSNDSWFHAQGCTGSHVVVPFLPQNKSNPGHFEKTKRDAAILALHFSQVRNDFAGDVVVTKKAHLKKKKGMAPGKWLVEKSETMFIKYSQYELEAILATLRMD